MFYVFFSGIRYGAFRYIEDAQAYNQSFCWNLGEITKE